MKVLANILFKSYITKKSNIFNINNINKKYNIKNNLPDIILWKQMVYCQVADPGSKTLLQPGLIPPCNGHQVPEPLMGNLMANKNCNILSPSKKTFFYYKINVIQ